MSFLRHKGIYRSDEQVTAMGSVVEKLRRRQASCRPLTHRLDEFPVGYSWQVALQQSPLPLHQPRLIVELRSVEGKNYFRPGAGVP
jgi:hypothetical protein